MASKAREAQRKSWEVDFVHLDLDKSQRAAVRTWDETGEQTINCLSRATLDGYKISVTHDKGNDSAICSITSPKVEAPKHQWCLSARAPDFFAAMRVLAYKIIVVLGDDLENAFEKAQSRDQWG